MTEIALILVPAAIAVPYLKSFFEEWGREDAKALRASLLSLFERGRKSRHDERRRFIPCQVTLGSARFYFHQVIDEPEFEKRIKAAHELVASLPDDWFEGNAGPPEYGMFWNRETEAWEGSIWQKTEFKGLPTDLWADE